VVAKIKSTSKKIPAGLKGQVFIATDNRQLINSEQIQLLQAIDDSGSISAAAKQVGISYKTAWDRVDAMNNMAEQALVLRGAGGRKGGGTQLTKYGKEVVAGFLAIEQDHQAFIQRVGGKVQTLNDISHYIGQTRVVTSARNQFYGKVLRLTRGEVNAEVVLQISSTQTIVAVITRESVKQLRLKKGVPVIAVIKASWILLSNDTSIATSARNKVIGTVARIIQGKVNSDVIIDLGEGKSLSATVTSPSVVALGLKKGAKVCGLFKASSVILMSV